MGTDVDLNGMALFVKIVDERSLSAAARALRLPKATISRRLSTLEKRLGAPLLIRSTRALSLTDLGQRFYDRVRPLVYEAEAVHEDTIQRPESPSGLLRVSASVAYGQAVIAPKLYDFLQQYPAIKIDLHLSDERVNLVAGGFDLVVRMGELEDSGLVARMLTEIPMAIISAPSHVQKYGTPKVPRDLEHHPAIVTRGDLNHWDIDGARIQVSWRLSTGNILLTCDAVVRGLGVALVPEFLVSNWIQRGVLVRLLPHSRLPKSRATALIARQGVRSPALRCLVDHLSKTPS